MRADTPTIHIVSFSRNSCRIANPYGTDLVMEKGKEKEKFISICPEGTI
jgi:hypothetical protein